MAVIKARTGQDIVIDDEDFVWLSSYAWRVGRDGYAAVNIHDNGKQRTLYMHRLLLGLNFGDRRQGDHRNTVKLDNRRENLRICTPSQNQHNRGTHPRNKCGYKGVSWFSRRQKWAAQICVNYKKVFLGYFDRPEDAAEAVRLHRAGLHGEFANHG